ncbi:MAG TPA: hypothetical protein VMH86_08200 [Rhizomicrobium sp.]|nr:hypothetical protein [Rhizomicrobium sp.]
MALFFDTAWFEARLAAAGLSRALAATALGLSEAELAEVWKDQRELSARDVAMLASLLGATPEEVAVHAGVSTPVPGPSGELADMRARLARVEQALAELRAAVAELKAK